MSTAIRLAVVGAGFMGRRYAQIAADLPGVQLAAVCDRDGTAAFDAAPDGVATVDSHQALIDNDLADAVIVALPEHAQVTPAIDLAAAGMHLLIEKPVASTKADAERIQQGLADTAGVHTVAHLLRADPRYRHAAGLVRDPGFGGVVHISASRRSRISTAQRVQGRTSLLYYLGVHDLDAIAWFAGSPITRVHASAARPESWPLPVDATILATLECANGAIAQLELTWAVQDSHPLGLDASIHVVGTEGTLQVTGGDEVLHSHKDGQQAFDALHWPELGDRVVGTLRYQVEQWLDAVAGNGQVACTIEDGLAAARVAFAIEEALRTGQPALVDY